MTKEEHDGGYQQTEDDGWGRRMPDLGTGSTPVTPDTRKEDERPMAEAIDLRIKDLRG